MFNLRPLTMMFVRHPLPWGAAATVAFYFALDAELIADPVLLRYLTGHWTAYVCMAMFLVGLAAMVIKAIDLFADVRIANAAVFDGLPASDLPMTDVNLLLQRLDGQHARSQRTYLVGRLRAALEYLGRKGSTLDLEDELRSLAEVDTDRKHSSYAMVRIMLWALPFVGSLGTVVGIANAVANLGPDTPVSSVAAVTPGLKLALETTALALVLSVSLMLLMFVADHLESRLLAAVDARANRELVGRFRGQTMMNGGQATAAEPGMNDAVMQAMEKMAQRQAEMWQANLDAVTKHWDEQTELLKKQIETTGTGPGGGGSGMGAAGSGGGLTTSDLQQVLMQTAGLAGMQHAEMAIHNEIMQELADAVRQDSRNWPVRKAMRRLHLDATPASGDVPVDWLQRS
jgi:biopolymer transport protein ExbB/TolQ